MQYKVSETTQKMRIINKKTQHWSNNITGDLKR